MKRRYLQHAIREDLQKKMVFIGGPRQVGKTTIAKMIADSFSRPTYLNWDSRTHRKAILDSQWSPDTDLIVFDELHKYAKWKSLIKGIWDTRRKDQKLIVTGSSRLDVFRRGGDSLMGRYHYYRLHPFSLKEIELSQTAPLDFPSKRPELVFQRKGTRFGDLLKFGGFPEPLLSGTERTLKRWQKQRFERVFREDIRDTEIVQSLSQIEILGYMLPDRVAAPLSLNSLAADIEVSPKTIKSWMELLCRNYYTFKVSPYHKRIQRALKKESKYYLWDWSEARGQGERFENMIGAHLLKFCHYYQDVFGVSANLFYLRDLEKRETDFLITWEHEPWCIVECKLKAGSSLTHINYFANKLDVNKRYLVICDSGVDHIDKRTDVRTISADKFLMALV